MTKNTADFIGKMPLYLQRLIFDICTIDGNESGFIIFYKSVNQILKTRFNIHYEFQESSILFLNSASIEDLEKIKAALIRNRNAYYNRMLKLKRISEKTFKSNVEHSNSFIEEIR